MNYSSMPVIYIEFLGDVPIYFGFGLQILTAIALGGLIGFDREQKMKAAGIKTNMLICVGATIYTAISMFKTQGMVAPIDPNRVSAQIVSGIGFLGAGAIIQAQGNIIGLTTAATIWVVAALGFTIGAGYPVAATIFTLTILIILRYLGFFMKLFETEKYERKYHMEVLTRGDAKLAILRFLQEEAEVESFDEEVVDEIKDVRIITIRIVANQRNISRMEYEIGELIRVKDVNFLEIKDD